MNNNNASSHSSGIKCEICFEDYDPQTRLPQCLPCGHTICSFCLSSIQKKCPTCRTSFQDNQVHKNYTLVDLLWKLRGKEECQTHKREMDRFCKSCMKLMCSVCHCKHIGSAAIISDMNLRDEIEMIKQTVIDAQSQAKAFRDKVENSFQAKVKEMDEKEASSIKKAEEDLAHEISRIRSEKNELVKKEEKATEQKIKRIEEQMKAAIEEAKRSEKRSIEEVRMKEKIEIVASQTKHKCLLENILSKKARLLTPAQVRNSQLLEKTEGFNNLQTQCDTLRQCEKLYQLWAQEKFKTAEILNLNKISTESLFGNIQEEFQVGDSIDFCKSSAQVFDAKIIQKDKDHIEVQYTHGENSFKETLNLSDLRLQKRWRKGDEFQVNNLIKVRGFLGWQVVRVKEVLDDEIALFTEDMMFMPKRLSKNSENIAELGANILVKYNKS